MKSMKEQAAGWGRGPAKERGEKKRNQPIPLIAALHAGQQLIGVGLASLTALRSSLGRHSVWLPHCAATSIPFVSFHQTNSISFICFHSAIFTPFSLLFFLLHWISWLIDLLTFALFGGAIGAAAPITAAGSKLSQLNQSFHSYSAERPFKLHEFHSFCLRAGPQCPSATKAIHSSH